MQTTVAWLLGSCVHWKAVSAGKGQKQGERKCGGHVCLLGKGLQGKSWQQGAAALIKEGKTEEVP